jgi:UDP-N-acetylmuramate dehydrogenase
MNRLPGQIGGTVRMNARCYGGEISQICTKVTVVTADGAVKTYADPKVFRGYKDTIFMDNGDIIAGAELTLTPGNKAEIEAKMNFCESDRVAKGQFEWPTCGCVFKNDYDVGVSSGMLLDHAGGKTLRHGKIEINPHHANFVYNKGGTSRDILEMSFKMREAVFKKFGVWMEYEMEILGDVDDDMKPRLVEARPNQMNEALLAPLRAKMSGKL